MRIVKKFKAGEAIHLVRDLQDFEKDCLLAVFVEDNADDQEAEKALSLLEFVRDRESWIECDCLASKQPLLTVALSSRGKPHLRHITWPNVYVDTILTKISSHFTIEVAILYFPRFFC